MSHHDKKSTPLKERRKHVRPSGSQEKRNYIRTAASVPLTVYIKKTDSAKGVKGHTRNISATGMMVECSTELPVGLDARIDFYPPGASNPVHCNGKVVWAGPREKDGRYNYGIGLTKIEEDNKNTFLKFLCDAIYNVASPG